MGDRYDFGGALAALREGRRVSREGWNGKGMWIALREPAQVLRRSEMTLPYIYMSTAQGDLVPWLASQTDLLAMDWQVLDDD
jgi:hypothetical protein